LEEQPAKLTLTTTRIFKAKEVPEVFKNNKFYKKGLQFC
jgi:hypothetical protein